MAIIEWKNYKWKILNLELKNKDFHGEEWKYEILYLRKFIFIKC